MSGKLSIFIIFKLFLCLSLSISSALATVSSSVSPEVRSSNLPVLLEIHLNRSVRNARTIHHLHFTIDDEWILLQDNRLMTSNNQYFSDLGRHPILTPAGAPRFLDLVEQGLQNPERLIFAIDTHNRWMVSTNGGESFVTSHPQYFSSIGLLDKIEQINRNHRRTRNNRPIQNVYLPPRGGWIAVDAAGTIFYDNIADRELPLLLDSLNDGKQTVDALSFRYNNRVHLEYVLASGRRTWVSANGDRDVVESARELQANSRQIHQAVLRPNGGHAITSHDQLVPAASDILSRMEIYPSGNDILTVMDSNNVPGVLIGLIQNGQITEIRNYGLRDYRAGQVMNTQTIFPTASLSKAVAATGIMALGDSFDQDRDIRQILRDSRISIAQDWYRSLRGVDALRARRIEFKRLLNNSSGLGVHGISLYAPGTNTPTLRDIIMGRDTPPRREKVLPEHMPGVTYQYSGGAFSLAESIVEDTFGRPFDRIIRPALFHTLQMNNSTFGSLNSTQRRNMSFGHSGDSNDHLTRLGYRECPGKAAGGMFSTIEDYGKFLQVYFQKGRIRRPNTHRPLLTRSEFNQLITPAYHQKSSKSQCSQDSDCQQQEESCFFNQCLKPLSAGSDLVHYGQGIRMSRARNSEGIPNVIRHGGNQPGFVTSFRINPQTGNGIIIFVNSSYREDNDEGNAIKGGQLFVNGLIRQARTIYLD